LQRAGARRHDHVANALGEIETGADFEILRLISRAYNLDHRFGDESNKAVLLVGFPAKDRDVRSLHGAVMETNADVECGNAGAVVI